MEKCELVPLIIRMIMAVTPIWRNCAQSLLRPCEQNLNLHRTKLDSP